jgi:hypothetical protein
MLLENHLDVANFPKLVEMVPIDSEKKHENFPVFNKNFKRIFAEEYKFLKKIITEKRSFFLNFAEQKQFLQKTAIEKLNFYENFVEITADPFPQWDPSRCRHRGWLC